MTEGGEVGDLVAQVATALRYAAWSGADAVSRSWAAPPAARAAVTASPLPSVPRVATPPVSPSPSPSPPPPRPAEPPPRAAPAVVDVDAGLRALRTRVDGCTRCIHATSRTNIVHGSGDPRARLMVVALGPDAASDAAGQPFQGEVGALLDRMLSAMGTSRAHSWLTYLTQCRSAEVGDDAIRTCTPYLRTQVELVRPAVMLLCGERTARFLLRSQAPLAELRGQWSSVLGMNAIATHDLEDLLRQPALKREAWADLQRAMQRLGTAPPQR